MAEVITIDGPTRAVLRGFLESDAMDLMDFESYVRDGNRDEAHRRSERAAYVCQLLDQLGWSEGAGDAELKLTVDLDRFTAWLRRQRAETEGARGDNVRSLEWQQAGQEGHYYCGSDQQESISLSESYIARDDNELRVIDTLLDGLVAGAAA